MAKHKILVIEDEPGYQDLMKYVFLDYDLTVCGSVEEVEKDHLDEKFDLIICDINLSGATGFYLLEKFSIEGRTEKVPFILWSSSDTPEIRQRASELGAAGFITKPFKTEAVQQMVQIILKSAE
ncbi:MAG TPA: hypothetical protein DCM05_09220 [Elusimicrobia bacterium]|nr:hypothetical protein [Elusimicrobiota bacterium]